MPFAKEPEQTGRGLAGWQSRTLIIYVSAQKISFGDHAERDGRARGTIPKRIFDEIRVYPAEAGFVAHNFPIAGGVNGRFEVDSRAARREYCGEVLGYFLSAFGQVRRARPVSGGRYLRRQFIRKCLQNASDHLLLNLRLPLADFDQPAKFRRELLRRQQRKAAPHSREWLRKIVNHEVDENFLFLYLMQQPLVRNRRLPGLLQKLHVVRELFLGIPDEHDALPDESKRERFQGQFAAVRAALDPGT